MGAASIRLAFKYAAGRQAHVGQGDDPFGPVGAGQIGVGLDPGRSGRQFRSHPVGLVGHGDQVGISLAGGIDLVGLGGCDDLGKEAACRSRGAWPRRVRRQPRCGRRRSDGASSAARGLDAAMAGGAVDVNHRRCVLVRCKGERSLPVERILGGDRLVEG